MTGSLPPEIPTSLQDAGLDAAFVEELVLKHQLFLTEFRLTDLSERVKLPISLLEPVLEKHRSEKLVEVKGAESYAKTSFVFRLTELGRRKGQECLERCRYSGPAPVSPAAYRDMVQKQTVKGAIGGEEALRKALSSLVVNDDVLRRLGVALASGHAVFIYGPSGNGKTAIAEAIGRALVGSVYIPYAVQVWGQVIKIYDPVCHTLADAPAASQEFDGRWVLIKRPVVNVGGELSLKMLDVSYDPLSKMYEASLQMKANNGLFILDDFGRQQAEPIRMLNRWLVPLERQVDHMTLETGVKFPIPFDAQVIFSTDLHPRDLVHEAFLRRLHYKIRIDPPTEEEFLAIFKRACASYGLQYSQVVYDYLNDQWYGSYGVARSACHPKDLISLIVTQSRYYAQTPVLNLENHQCGCSRLFRHTVRGTGMNKKGQATLEFALTALVLFTFLFAFLDLSILFYVTLRMQSAVREGVRQVVIGPSRGNGDLRSALRDTIKSYAGNLYDKNANDVKDPAVVVRDQRNFANYSGSTVSDTGSASQIIMVRLTYSWPLLTPILRPFFPGGRYTFTVRTTMRNEPW